MSTFVIPTRTLPEPALLLLGLLADGMTEGEIARAIGQRPAHVGTLVRCTMTALSVESRAQAVAMAYKQGWLSRVPAARRGRAFSPRQLEAVRLLAAGVTEASTARVMGLVTGSVRSLYSEASERIGARSRAHLVRLVIDTGLAEVRPIGGQP